jgi:hypothetical protein
MIILICCNQSSNNPESNLIYYLDKYREISNFERNGTFPFKFNYSDSTFIFKTAEEYLKWNKPKDDNELYHNSLRNILWDSVTIYLSNISRESWPLKVVNFMDSVGIDSTKVVKSHIPLDTSSDSMIQIESYSAFEESRINRIYWKNNSIYYYKSCKHCYESKLSSEVTNFNSLYLVLRNVDVDSSLNEIAKLINNYKTEYYYRRSICDGILYNITKCHKQSNSIMISSFCPGFAFDKSNRIVDLFNKLLTNHKIIILKPL